VAPAPVMRRCANLCDDDSGSAIRYVATNDRQFQEGAPYSNVTTLYAYEWVDLVRTSRARLGMKGMPKPGDI